MTEKLQLKALIIAECFKFHMRNQGSLETVSQYLAELRRLAYKCECEGYLDEALHNRFCLRPLQQIYSKKAFG